MHAIGQKPEAALLRHALTKLAAFLPEQVTFTPSTIVTTMTFQPMPYVMVEPYNLQALPRAAAAQRTVSVQYHSQRRNELTERQIDMLHCTTSRMTGTPLPLIICARLN
jgi:hypothetical protein